MLCGRFSRVPGRRNAAASVFRYFLSLTGCPRWPDSTRELSVIRLRSVEMSCWAPDFSIANRIDAGVAADDPALV
jgi:hypothetical protein